MPKSRPPEGDPSSSSPTGPAGRGGQNDPSSVTAAQEWTWTKSEWGRCGRKEESGGTQAGTAGPVWGPAAKIALRPPNPRHLLNSIRRKSRSEEINTVVLPGTDVAGDLADISAGRGEWKPESNRYEVNGRTYAVESGGTVFPTGGPGLVNLTRSEYKVLKELIGFGGDVAATREALRRDPSVSDVDWTVALEVFRHHKSYRGGA
jgi:hypothetical protein